jgi:hypothetical protein
MNINPRQCIYIFGFRVNAEKAEKVFWSLGGIVFLLAFCLHMNFIAQNGEVFLELYESFDIPPSRDILFLTATFRYWILYALLHAGIFGYFFLYRNESWPVWWMLAFALLLPAYFYLSFPQVRLVSV